MKELITINLDGTERRVHSDLWRIWLLPGEPEPGVVIRGQIDPNAPLRWEELDRLPELVEIHYSGRDTRVQEYLEARPSITRLAWRGHDQPVIDVSRTSLQELTFDCGTCPLEVRLPAAGALRRITLKPPADPAALRLRAPNAGAGVHLTLQCHGLPEGPYALSGLERIVSLSAYSVQQVRLERLLPCQELEELSIVGPPGAIADIEQLAGFPKLRLVKLRECYELRAEALPPRSALPALVSLEVDGVRQSDAAILTQRFAGLSNLSIRGKRSDAWLRANLTNPFREWPDEYGAAVGKAALAAYRKASAAIDGAGPDANPDQVRAALQTFVAAFNRLGARKPLDTLQREEVADAFDELASRVPDAAPPATARAWFDEWEEL